MQVSKQKQEDDVINALFIIAELTQFNLSKTIAALYLESLRVYGLECAKATIMGLAKSAKPGRWPSISDILEKMGRLELTDESKAVDVAARIIGAVGNFGRHNWEQARSHIGEIGEYVVANGHGWISLCDGLTNDQIPTVRAQIREQALAAIRKQKNGTLDRAPKFNELEGNANPSLQRALDIASDQTEKVEAGRDSGKRPASLGPAMAGGSRLLS